MVSFKALFTAVFAFAMVFPAGVRAFSVPKVSFEQQTGVFVWTKSGSKDSITTEDDLTDLKRSCDALATLPASESPKILAQRSKIAPVFQALTETSTKTLTRRLGLQKMKLKMNPVLAEVGREDRPIFFLFPEVHMNGSTRALHRSLANDVLRVTHVLDRSKTRILNMYEGAQGTWEKTTSETPSTIRERNLEATALFDKHGFSAFRIIGEVYNDRIETEYHDDNDLAIKNILALQAYAHAQSNLGVEEGWYQSVQFLKNNVPGRARLIDFEEYQSFYEEFRNRDLASLKKLSSDLCEQRSLEMAKYTFDLANRRRAKVVYMSFGALHAHGIIEQLKKYSASFIVFSPNL